MNYYIEVSTGEELEVNERAFVYNNKYYAGLDSYITYKTYVSPDNDYYKLAGIKNDLDTGLIKRLHTLKLNGIDY